MNARRIVGLVLAIAGVAILAWGGIFWTDRDTVIDAGPIEVQTAEREGVTLPPILGGLVLVAGIVLLVMPSRVRT
jgi:drug/metabolite transporter (DMT)-like permease